MIKIKRNILVLLIVLAAIAITGAGYLFYLNWQTAQNSPEQQTKNLLNRLGQVVELPAEAPTIATIADVSKLSNEILRSRAQNGDKLLIYHESKRLVLYRPNSQKVIELLTIQNHTQEAESHP